MANILLANTQVYPGERLVPEIRVLNGLAMVTRKLDAFVLLPPFDFTLADVRGSSLFRLAAVGPSSLPQGITAQEVTPETFRVRLQPSLDTLSQSLDREERDVAKKEKESSEEGTQSFTQDPSKEGLDKGETPDFMVHNNRQRPTLDFTLSKEPPATPSSIFKPDEGDDEFTEVT